jgi:hypothetical protein
VCGVLLRERIDECLVGLEKGSGVVGEKLSGGEQE